MIYNYTMIGPDRIGFWTRSEINKNFKIKFYGTLSDGRQVNTLVGVKGMFEELGEELATTLVQNAFDCGDDKFNRKLHRGLQVTFYTH